MIQLRQRAGRCSAETWALRDAMRALTGRYPKPAVDLFEALTNDWGGVVDRRLWRILWWLVGRGLVVRVGDRNHSDGYVLGYGVESAWDHHDRERVELRQRRQCFDCRERLDRQRAWWCGPRCRDCALAFAYGGYRRRRDALEAAGLCVQCGVRESDKPWCRCSFCLSSRVTNLEAT